MTGIIMWGLEIQTRDQHLHQVYFNSTLAKERFLRDLRPFLAGHRVIGGEDRQRTASDILGEVRDQLRRDLDEEVTAAARIQPGDGPAARRDRQWALQRAEILDSVLTMLDHAEGIRP